MYSKIFQKILHFPSQKGFFVRNVFSENISILKNNIICAEATKVPQIHTRHLDFGNCFFLSFCEGDRKLTKRCNGKGHPYYRGTGLYWNKGLHKVNPSMALILGHSQGLY
jgi:hypothetical protein